MSLSSATRRLSRKLLGIAEPVKEVDSDTRRILKESLSKAIYSSNDTSRAPKIHKDSKDNQVTIKDVTTAPSVHVNFHKTPTQKFQNLQRVTQYYSEDGKLLI
jgi:hypothetical protein